MLRQYVLTTALYGRTAGRVALRSPRRRLAVRSTGQQEERMVFVVGSPRSGTTFVAESLAAQPGFVDLGEVKPLKAAIPNLVGRPEQEAAAQVRRTLEWIRRLALVRRFRAVEQTPEISFLVGAALRAYPQGRLVHVIRDGRDVACSLLERGWLSQGRAGHDDARLAYGAHSRFWVEPERIDEFVRSSDATRAAWAWRRYVTAARAAAAPATLELRYEALVSDPAAAAACVAEHLGVDPAPLIRAFSRAHGRSIGRWQRDLIPAELADVQREAGALLTELGYD
jgi:Sulfotransferase family